MSPLLETFGNASARGFGGIGAGGGGSSTSYELISSTILGSNTTSVTFSSIPQTYSHLQLRSTVRSSNYSGDINGWLTFNGSSTGYNYHSMFGNGSGVYYDGYSGTAQIELRAFSLGNTGNANIWSSSIIDILDYSASTKYKTVKGLMGFTGSVYFVNLNTGSWQNTAAVSSITISATAGGTAQIMTGSRLSLYGIKG